MRWRSTLKSTSCLWDSFSRTADGHGYRKREAPKRIYSKGGARATSVFAQQDADHYKEIARIPTGEECAHWCFLT
jgi:hypothetical protein